jgi:CHAD domain-containing protein
MHAVTETGRFAADQLAKLLERLAFQVNTTVHSRNADAVHDLRVAIRRFTQVLIVFKDCFPARESKRVRKQLKDLMTLAGDVRDCDIALKLLEKASPDNSAGLRERLGARRREAAKALVGALTRLARRGYSAKWRAALVNGQAPNEAKQPFYEDVGRKELPRIVKRFRKLGDQAATGKASAEELHVFRIEAKKLRYTLELFQPAYGPVAKEVIDRLRGLQTVLGDINDCRSTRALLGELGMSSALEDRLKKRQRRKTNEFHKLWDKEFTGALMRQWTRNFRRTPRKPMARSTSAVDKVAVGA